MRRKQELQSAVAPIEVIQAYERFCRGLHDAFDTPRAAAATSDPSVFEIPRLPEEDDFRLFLHGTDARYADARQRFGKLKLQTLDLLGGPFCTFVERNAAALVFALAFLGSMPCLMRDSPPFPNGCESFILGPSFKSLALHSRRYRTQTIPLASIGATAASHMSYQDGISTNAVKQVHAESNRPAPTGLAANNSKGQRGRLICHSWP